MSGFFEKLKSKKTVRAGIAYTIGGYLLKGLGFITVPIFTRILSTSDFGMYNTFLSYEAILYLFISYALHVSVKNARYDFGMDKLDSYLSNISLLPLFTMGVCLVAVNLFSKPLEAVLGLNRLSLNLLVVYSYCTGLIILYQNRLVLEYQYKQYLLITYFNALVNIALSLFLIHFVFAANKYMGRIIGTVIPAVIVSVVILYSLYKKNAPRVNSAHLKYALKLGVPIIPHGLGQILLSSFDRVMITNMVGADKSGIYSFSYTIFTMLQVASTALFSVFEPWAYERLKDNKISALKKVSGLLFAFLCLISIAVIVVSPEAIVLLGSEKYSEAIYTTIPVIVGGLFSLAYGIPTIIEYYHKKTILISVGTIGAAVINVVLNFIFIPRFGYVAAAYTTLVSYGLYFIFHSIISYRIAGFMILPGCVLVAGFGGVFLCATMSLATLNAPVVRYVVLLVIGLIGAWICYRKRGIIVSILKKQELE